MIVLFVLVDSRDIMTFIHINLGISLIALASTFLCVDLARSGYDISDITKFYFK